MSTQLEKKTKSEVTNYHPGRLMNIFDEMERMFENFSANHWLRPSRQNLSLFNDISTSFDTVMPDVDVIDRDGEIIVKAVLPGVDKKDLDVSITKNSVTIKGETHHEEKEEKGDYYRCEISKGSYMRTLALPAEVNEDKAKAKFKDGMLELTLPKIEVAHRRKVTVD